MCRFVAERGSGGQLIHVENIDKIFGLKESTPLFLESVKKEVPVGSPEKPLPVSSLTPRYAMLSEYFHKNGKIAISTV